MNFINDRRRMRGQGGFTLIELLVVIAILGVLAGVVVFSVNGLQNNSQDSACKIDKRTIETAVEAFRAQSANSSYPAPAGIDGLDNVPAIEGDASKYWVYSAAENPAGSGIYVTPTYTKVAGAPANC